MTDETSAPAGAGTAPLAPATEKRPPVQDSYSQNEAAEAIARLRQRPEEEQPPESAEAATGEPELADEASADPQIEAPGEEPNEAEPAEQPPIEPPRSWTKEAKERWQSLPRETQEYLAQREQEREREFRRSQNEAADHRKAIEAERVAVEKAKQEYEARLPALMQALQDAQAGAYSDIKTMDDVTRLANEDPFRYLQWQAHQQKIQAVQYELQNAEKAKSEKHQSEWAQHVQKENQLVAEKAPELADPTKAKELTAKAVDKLHDIGFSDQELADLSAGKQKLSIWDHRVQLLLLDGLKYADIMKAKTAAVAKPVPPVQKPGIARAPNAAAQEQVQALKSKLKTSGDPRDAVAALAAMRAQESRRRA